MVRCMLKRKVYEICSSPETEVGGGGIKCMMNSVICYPGATNVLEAEAQRELRAALWATKIVEQDFDDEAGRPRVKIVYVDQGPMASPSMEKEACKHMETIEKAEKDKEKKEGVKGPRLIFVRQDRDYWPGSDKAAMSMMRSSEWGPDYKEIYVPEDEKARKAYPNDILKETFMRYYDPSLPGTKFIIDNIPPSALDYVLDKYKADPELWHGCICHLNMTRNLHSTSSIFDSLFLSSSISLGFDFV